MGLIRTVALGGEPATGKTTIAKLLMTKAAVPLSLGSCGLLRFHYREEGNLFVLGRYDEMAHAFAGTDRLSMAVQPDAIAFLQKLVEGGKDCSVFFEGDRLFTRGFLQACRDVGELKLFILIARGVELAMRHASRGDTQSQRFIKGRQTKVAGIASVFQDCAERRHSSSPQEADDIADEILKALAG